MSFRGVCWAMTIRTGASSTKLALVALAELARDPQMLAVASASLLVQRTELDRKTCLAAVKRLVDAGLIVRRDERVGRGGCPVFQVMVPADYKANDQVVGTTVTHTPSPVSGPAIGTTSPGGNKAVPPQSGTTSGSASETREPRSDAESGITKARDHADETDGSGAEIPANQYQFSLEVVPNLGANPLPVLQDKEDTTVRADAASTSTATVTKPAQKSQKQGLTMAEWLRSLPAGERPIPETDAVFSYARKIDLPPAFLHLAWLTFKSRFVGDDRKRQRCWRKTFQNYVQRDYLGLWRVDGSGQFYLTTAGRQAEREHSREELAA